MVQPQQFALTDRTRLEWHDLMIDMYTAKVSILITQGCQERKKTTVLLSTGFPGGSSSETPLSYMRLHILSISTVDIDKQLLQG